MCKNCFKDFSLSFVQKKKITEIVLYENERKVMHGCRFSWKKLTSAMLASKKGACQTVKEIAFQFDIGVETITKFKLQKRKKNCT